MATAKENKELWDGTYDWKDHGHEWSVAWGGADMEWYGTILPRLHAFVPTGTILEIAPGFGRWTFYLKDLCERLILVDLSSKCIDACRKKFASCSHIDYHVNDGYSLDMIPDDEIDLVFSFDSLVHAERDVITSYVHQIGKKLKKNGLAFLHHSNIGQYRGYFDLCLKIKWPKKLLEKFNIIEPTDHWRAYSMTASEMEKIISKAGLKCIGQELINWGTKPSHMIDCITLFTHKGSIWDRPVKRLSNKNFMAEVNRISKLAKLYGQHSFKKIQT